MGIWKILIFATTTAIASNSLAPKCDWFDFMVAALYKKGPIETDRAYRDFFLRYDLKHLTTVRDVEAAAHILMELPDPKNGSWVVAKLEEYFMELQSMEGPHALAVARFELLEPVGMRLLTGGSPKGIAKAMMIADRGPSDKKWEYKDAALWRARVVKEATALGNRDPDLFLHTTIWPQMQSTMGFRMGGTESGQVVGEIFKNWGSDPASPLFKPAIDASIEMAMPSGNIVPVPTIQLFRNYLDPKVVPVAKRDPIAARKIQEILANRESRPQDPMFDPVD